MRTLVEIQRQDRKLEWFKNIRMFAKEKPRKWGGGNVENVLLWSRCWLKCVLFISLLCCPLAKTLSYFLPSQGSPRNKSLRFKNSLRNESEREKNPFNSK